MNIRHFSPDDVDAFLTLYEAAFGSDWLTEAYVRWKYTSLTELADWPIVVAEEEGELVGAIGLLALRLRVEDVSVLGIQPVDVMVHPEHRGKNVFLDLIQAARNRLYPDEYLEFGWPNADTVGIWTRLQQWTLINERTHKFRYHRLRDHLDVDPEDRTQRITARVLCWLYRAWLPLRDARSLPSAGVYDVTVHAEPPVETLAEMYARTTPGRLHVVRDVPFYENRLANPLNAYTTYVAEDPDGVSVATLIISKFEHGDTVEVADVLPIDPSSIRLDGLRAILRRVIRDHSEAAALKWSPALPEELCGEYGFSSSEWAASMLESGPAAAYTSSLVPDMEPMTLCGHLVGFDSLPVDYTDYNAWHLSGIEKDTI